MRLFDKLLASGEKKFAFLVIEGLRRAGESRPIQFEKERFRLVVGDQAFPLTGFYQEYRGASSHIRAAVLERAVQSWRGDEPQRVSASVAVDRLLPMLLPRGAVELHALGTEENLAWPHKIIGEHLAAVLGAASSGEAKPLSASELAGARVDDQSCWERACDNLRRRKGAWRQIAPSCLACETTDGAAAARMLLAREIEELPITGEPVVMPIAADVLLAADRDDAHGLVQLAERARGELENPQLICGFAFCGRGDLWRPWLPSRGHPAYASLKLLQMETLSRAYVQQKQFLEELGRKAGEPMCLASYSAMQDERTGEPMSFTVWPEGLEILLPQADLVVFFQPDECGQSGRVVTRAAWDDVLHAMGDLMEPLGSYPPRWLVRDFPGAARTHALAAE